MHILDLTPRALTGELWVRSYPEFIEYGICTLQWFVVLAKAIRRLTGERILLPLSLMMKGAYGYIWQRNMKYCDMS